MQAPFQDKLKLATMLIHSLACSRVGSVLTKHPFSALIRRRCISKKNSEDIWVQQIHMSPIPGALSTIWSMPSLIGKPLSTQISFFGSPLSLFNMSKTSWGMMNGVPCLIIPAGFFLVQRVSSRSSNNRRLALYLYCVRTLDTSNWATLSISVPR